MFYTCSQILSKVVSPCVPSSIVHEVIPLVTATKSIEMWAEACRLSCHLDFVTRMASPYLFNRFDSRRRGNFLRGIHCCLVAQKGLKQADGWSANLCSRLCLRVANPSSCFSAAQILSSRSNLLSNRIKNWHFMLVRQIIITFHGTF